MNMDTNKINDLAKILRQNQLTKLCLIQFSGFTGGTNQ